MKRFWDKVKKGDHCWSWTGAATTKGYGRININGRLVLAHRLSWEMENGPVPDGLWVLHSCDNPPCVRPSHLFLGNQSMNMLDCAAKGRICRDGGRKFRIGNVPANRRLDDVQVKLSLALMPHFSLSELARIFGVSVTTMKDLSSGRTYRRVA